MTKHLQFPFAVAPHFSVDEREISKHGSTSTIHAMLHLQYYGLTAHKLYHRL